MKKEYITNRKKIYIGIGILLLIVAWEIASLIYNNKIVFPDVIETAKALGGLLIEYKTYKIILFTILKLAVVLIVSLCLSLVMAVFSYKSYKFKNIMYPLISLFKTIPVASIIIILIVIIGHKMSAYFITLFVVMPIMYEGIYNALIDIPQDILDDVKIQSNMNITVVKDIYIPLIKNDVLASILQSFGLGLKVLVMAEFISQPNFSIGRELLEYRNNFEFDNVFAWTVILVCIVIIFDNVISKIKEK